MLAYFGRLTPRHRRSWALVAAYLGFLLLSSFLDFGPNTAGQTIFRGVAPFVVSDIGRLTVLILFPAISLYLPQFVS